MIIFPAEYVKTKYPGYFWNINTKQLYSIKSGALKPLKLNKGGFVPYRYITLPPHYQVSVQGVKRYLLLDDLVKLTIPVQNEIVDIV
jgi:hypothetical protein